MTKKEVEYFDYLISQFHIPAAYQDRDYSGLFGCLHNKEFVWVIPNDDNRIEDAKDLRREFWGEGHWLPRKGVSILEVIVALSRRLEFNAGGNQETWAWKLIRNLKLDRCWNPLTERKIEKIEDILNAVIWRTYEPDGKGGFFPLRQSREDQREVELWYQMQAYINEHVVT